MNVLPTTTKHESSVPSERLLEHKRSRFGVLDLDLAIQAKDQLWQQTSKSLDLPVRISLREYPGLRQLAWHLPDVKSLSLLEAYRLYERNQRHLDHTNLTDSERDLLRALLSAFQGEL